MDNEFLTEVQMKLRNGFVSNSSSSSFIIARAQCGDEKFAALKSLLANNGIDSASNNDYLVVDTESNYVEEESLNSIGLTASDYFMYYG